MEGSITFNELVNMPLPQYRALKRAIEIEQLFERARIVSDLSHAFGGSKDYVNHLKTLANNLTVNNFFDTNNSKISWDNKDPNYVSKLSKWSK